MKIVIEPYNPEWVTEFRRHEERIRAALEGLRPAPSIDHIGSTAIEGIGAKPIIDILAGVEGEGQLGEIVEPMMAARYVYVQKFETGMPYRRFFVELRQKGSAPLPKRIGFEDEALFGKDYESLVHIHVMERESHHWARHIAFRDYMREHAEAREAYYRLKLEVAQREFENVLDYNSHKAEFVAEYQEKALEWYEGKKQVME